MTLEELNSLEVGDVVVYLHDDRPTFNYRNVIIKTDDYIHLENPNNGNKFDGYIKNDITFLLDNYKLGYTKVKDTRLARKMYPNAELKNGLLIIKEI